MTQREQALQRQQPDQIDVVTRGRELLQPMARSLALWVPDGWAARIGQRKDQIAAKVIEATCMQLRSLDLALRDKGRKLVVNPAHLRLAVLSCMQVGLMPHGGILGHAYLLPFWNKDEGMHSITLCVGYKGLKELAARVGIREVPADLVYDGDKWDESVPVMQAIENHYPGPNAKDSSPPEIVRYGYAYGVYSATDHTRPAIYNGKDLDDARKRAVKRNPASYAGSAPRAWMRNQCIRRLLSQRLSLGGDGYGAGMLPALEAAESGRMSVLRDHVLSAAMASEVPLEAVEEAQDIIGEVVDERPAEEALSPHEAMAKEAEE